MTEISQRNESEAVHLDPFAYVLSIMSFFEKDQKFKLKEIDIHKFFFDLIKNNPELCSDVIFDDDPELPYSEDIAEALLRLQDADVFARPNPAMSEYLIKSDLSNTNDKISANQKDILSEVADRFKRNFGIEA